MVGRWNDRGPVAGIDEQREAFAVAGEPDRARRQLCDGDVVLQQRDTPQRPVEIGADLAQGALESLFNRIALVRRSSKSAQQAHLGVLVLQLEAVLQLALVGTRQPVRVRQQRGGHRLERSDQRIELIAATNRGATGKAQRQLLGPVRQFLYRRNQVTREVQARRDRRQDREQDDGGERVGRVAQLTVGVIIRHQHRHGQRFGKQRQWLERHVQGAVERDRSAVTVRNAIRNLFEPARILRGGRARQCAIARNQSDVEADACRQARDVLGTNAVLGRHHADHARARVYRNDGTQVQSVEPLFRRERVVARQCLAHDGGLVRPHETIASGITDTIDKLTARVVDLGHDVTAQPSRPLRPDADRVVGIGTSQGRHQVRTLRQRAGSLLDSSIVIEDRGLYRRRATFSPSALLRHEQCGRAAMMKVVADADRPSCHQHEHTDHRQCDGAEARMASGQHDGTKGRITTYRTVVVGRRRCGTTHARSQQSTKSLHQGGGLSVRHGQGASGRTGQTIEAG